MRLFSIRTILLFSFFTVVILTMVYCSDSNKKEMKEQSIPINAYLNHIDTAKYLGMDKCQLCHQDIYAAKQLRLMICDKEYRAIGSIDLFDFEPNHLRAGVGILIAEKNYRLKGYAFETLKLLINYCFERLNLYQLYCNITPDNEPSILLFQQYNFQITGIKKQWVRDGNTFKDELLLQRVR